MRVGPRGTKPEQGGLGPIAWLTVEHMSVRWGRRPVSRRGTESSKTRRAIMAKNIYVGNLPYSTTGDDLVELFQAYGSVTSGQVIIDKFSGRSRGFGFVEMSNDDEAQAAIDALNGSP